MQVGGIGIPKLKIESRSSLKCELFYMKKVHIGRMMVFCAQRELERFQTSVEKLYSSTFIFFCFWGLLLTQISENPRKIFKQIINIIDIMIVKIMIILWIQRELERFQTSVEKLYHYNSTPTKHDYPTDKIIGKKWSRQQSTINARWCRIFQSWIFLGPDENLTWIFQNLSQ